MAVEKKWQDVEEALRHRCVSFKAQTGIPDDMIDQR
jgi:hypothetical protein